MKNILLMLLVLVGAGCSTQRVVSQQTLTDSTTTITYRAVPLVIKPDTLSDTLNLHKFTHTFNKAAVGAVIAHKRNGRASYSIRKTSSVDFEVEAIAAGKDTTVTVADTTRRVHTRERVVVEQQPTLLGKLWQTSKVTLLLGVLLLLLVLGLIRKFTS